MFFLDEEQEHQYLEMEELMREEQQELVLGVRYGGRLDQENRRGSALLGDPQGEQTVVTHPHHQQRIPSYPNFVGGVESRIKLVAVEEEEDNSHSDKGKQGAGMVNNANAREMGGFQPRNHFVVGHHNNYPPSAQTVATIATATQKAKKWHFKDYYKMVDDHLGSGAYASVRTVIHLASGREYAVKVVNKHEHGHTRSRILREVQIFKMCRNHPNIVQLVEWFEDESCFYIVFEKMRGGPLLNHIQRRVCFTEQEASLVTRDIANALKFLHDRGIAHRDVKPENILCTELENISPVKLCDLDLASKPFSQCEAGSGVRNNAGLSVGGGMHPVQSEPDLASPVGSAEFMAPEVVDTFVGEALKYDKRCDMWSLGVIIYIMLCGYPPFYGECERENCGWDQGESCADCQENLFSRIQMGYFDFPEEEWTNISAEAKDLIRHLLVRNVRQRYTADEVLAHPWVTRGAPKTPLQTATNLSRNDSARDVRTVNEHFLMMNRMAPMIARISQRLEAAGMVVNGSTNPPNAVGTGPLSSTTGLHHHQMMVNNTNYTSTNTSATTGGGGANGGGFTLAPNGGNGPPTMVTAGTGLVTSPSGVKLESCQFSQLKRPESKQDVLAAMFSPHHHRQPNRETQVHV